MKKIILCCIIIAVTFTVQAQAKFFQNYLIGTWTGDLKGTSTRSLKIVIATAKFREDGISTITGYSTVNGKNKTNFAGTFKFEDGYLDLTLNENGNKKTDGIFKLATQGPPDSKIAAPKVLIGNWTSFDTQNEKTVLVAKKEK